MKILKFRTPFSILLSLTLPAIAHASAISLINDDALNYSSFTTGTTNWSNGSAAGPGNTYDTTTHGMRSQTSGNATFAGDSLTLSTPSNPGGYSLAYKVGSSATLTANWILNGGVVAHNNASTQLGTFGGTMNVGAAGGTFNAKQGPFMISAALSGSGNLTFTTAGAGFTNGLSGSNAAFSGSLIWSGSPAPTVVFMSTNSVPGNPASPTPGQITLAGTLLDLAGLSLTNSNGGMTVAANSTLNLSAPITSPMTISEPISGSANLVKRGGGILTLSGDNSAFSGGLNLFGINTGGQLNINSSTALGTGTFAISSGNNALIDNTSGGPITLINNNSQIWSNNFAFIGSSALNMGSGAVDMFGASVAVTVSNSTLTVGPVHDDGSTRSLTKNGKGTLAVNNGAYYGGNTIVNAGTLALIGSGPLSSPGITVVSNATLDVTGIGGLNLNNGQTITCGGTIAGNISDGAGSTTLNPGQNPGAGTFIVNGSLNLNGGTTINLDLSGTPTIGSGINDLLVVSNTLNIAGTTTINFIGIPTTGTYTLIQYGTFAGSMANLSAPPGFTLVNDTVNNAIELVVTHVPAALAWQGDGIANTWDVDTTANWLQSGTNQFFFSGDSVTFTDTGSDSPSINITSTGVSPASTTVNATQTYDFTGGGILTGNLTKSGSGTLIIENSNIYSGLTLVSGGTLQIGNGSQGNVGTGAISNNAAIVFNLGTGVAVANTISGTGSVAQSGTGDVNLSASNSYTGLTTVNSGRLLVGNGSALGATNSGTVVNTGSQVYVVANVNLAEPFSLNGTGTDGNGALRKGGGGASTNAGTTTLTADSTIGVDGGATWALNAPVSGAFALTKNGPGTLALNSSNGYASTVISSGVINLGTNNALGAGPVTSTSAGRFVLANGLVVTNSFSAPALNPGTATGFLMVNDNTNGTITTVSGPLDFEASPATGGNFAGPTSSGYLNVTGTITNSPGTFVMVRFGNVRFSGGGDYQQLQVRANTTSIGANNGIATDAVVDIGGNGSTTVPTLLDLNGFNQTLAGLVTAITPSNIGWVTNSGASASTLTLNVGDGNTQIFGGGIVGNLSLVVDSGTQFLATNGFPLGGLYLYNGNTIISGGTLALGMGVVITNTPVLSITNGAILDVTAAGVNLSPLQVLAGNGTVNGEVTGGGVSPGNAAGQIGQLTINGDIVLTGPTTFEVNKTAGTNDLLTVSGSVTYGGTLKASNLGGPLNIGDSFTVVTASGQSGAFISISGTPGPGQAWSFANGVLSVIAGVANNPTNITFSVSGNTLNLTWPGDHLGWFMQSNSVGLTSSSNWFDIAGSQNGTNVAITINPAQPQVFFRMRQP